MTSRQRSKSRYKRTIRWNQVYKWCEELAKQIKPLEYRTILVVKNGGVIPGSMLAYMLGADTYQVYPDMSTCITGHVLLFDDVCDTGETFINLCKKSDCNFTTACLVNKPWTKYKPDFYACETKDWVVLPWEKS